jgi:two-component system nitrogen regulation response regulator GlnG
VSDGSFREPLLHRLAGFVLEIPPLRERREDVGRLLVHFLRLELDKVGELYRLEAPRPGAHPWLPAPLVARLALHPWPGNVRQLRNVVRELVTGSRGSAQVRLRPTVEKLLDEAVSGAPRAGWDRETASAPAAYPDPSEPRRPDQISEDELRAALAASLWRPFAAARRLGISRGSIYDLMQKSPSIHNAADLSKDRIKAGLEQADGSVEAAALELEVSSLGLRRRMKQLGLSGE